MMKQIESGAWKIVAGALIFSFGLSLLASIGHHSHSPAPTTAAAQPVAAATATARPRTASTTMPAPLVVVFPGLTPPAGLASGRVGYSLAGAVRIDYGKYGEFVKIGSAGVPSSTTSFSSLPVPSLSADLPARGLARESWTIWTRVHTPGEQVFAIRLQAPDRAVAELHVDGQGSAIANLDNNGTAGQQTAIGQTSLASGWHEVEVSVTHSVGEPPSSTHVDVFMRGPDESTPVNFTPFAPAASAPHEFPTGGGAHPAPTATEKKL